MKKGTILIVDDDENLVYVIKDVLEREGYDVLTACDGNGGMQAVITKQPDLVIADVMMPSMDGFNMLESIRRIGNSVPVIIITARSDTNDLLHGFSIGANDYVRKPFEMSELVARVKAHLRGRRAGITKHPVIVGDCTLNAERNELVVKKKVHKLAFIESVILCELMSHPGVIVETGKLILLVWGSRDSCHTNRLHGHIYKIRGYFEGSASVDIVNVRGVGYKLVDKSEEQNHA